MRPVDTQHTSLPSSLLRPTCCPALLRPAVLRCRCSCITPGAQAPSSLPCSLPSSPVFQPTCCPAPLRPAASRCALLRPGARGAVRHPAHQVCRSAQRRGGGALAVLQRQAAGHGLGWVLSSQLHPPLLFFAQPAQPVVATPVLRPPALRSPPSAPQLRANARPAYRSHGRRFRRGRGVQAAA